MTDSGKRTRGIIDQAVGKVKRAVGELTARPDMVLDGEEQETLGHRERLAAGEKRDPPVDKR